MLLNLVMGSLCSLPNTGMGNWSKLGVGGGGIVKRKRELTSSIVATYRCGSEIDHCFGCFLWINESFFGWVTSFVSYLEERCCCHTLHLVVFVWESIISDSISIYNLMRKSQMPHLLGLWRWHIYRYTITERRSILTGKVTPLTQTKGIVVNWLVFICYKQRITLFTYEFHQTFTMRVQSNRRVQVKFFENSNTTDIDNVVVYWENIIDRNEPILFKVNLQTCSY